MHDAAIAASALILRRDDDDDRLFLARRAPGMRFLGSVYAFVGGRVDERDVAVGGGDPTAVLRSALVREVCEELGLDLRPGAASAGRVDDATRAALIEGSADWARSCAKDELVALGDPLLRLITPDFHPRRFDTCFFLATLGGRALGSLLAEELDDGGWDTARGWLGRFERGDLLLAPPTVLTLGAIAERPFEAWPAALAALQAEVEGPAPQPIWNNPAVQLIPLRTPTIPPASHTNAYLVGRDPAYLVDPATPHEDEQVALALALRRATDEGRRLRAILLTHDHPDHIGAVEFVRRTSVLPVWAHAETAARVPFAIDRILRDGELLDLGVGPDGRGGWTLQCVFTPGHAPGHLAFYESRYGSLVAGDMVSTLSSILVHPDDGDLDEYMNSLERLAGLDVRIVFPAHGPASARGRQVLIDQIEHRRARERSVRAAIESGADTVGAITRLVYDDVPSTMLELAAQSLRSMLRSLARRGLVRMEGDRVEAP